MSNPYCDECSMRHDVCPCCGAAIVASLYLHRKMNAHGEGRHWCGQGNPGYQAMLRAMREESDNSRELLTECPVCASDVIRRADSPELYEVHGYYGLLGDTAIHICTQMEPAPVPPRQPSYKEAVGTVPGHGPAPASQHWRIDL